MSPALNSRKFSGLRHRRGFTYIELLAVVFIIGLVVSLVVIRIDRDLDRLALLEARRFAELIEFTRDESIMDARPMGIFLGADGKSYRFAYFTDSWHPASSKGTEFRTRDIPDNVGVEMLHTSAFNSGQDKESDNAEPGESKSPQPQVIIEPSGLVSPFVMKFAGSTIAYLVNPDLDQDIVVSQENI